MIPQLELAWAAGLFEGEGSVRISKPAARNWGSLNVDVPNTDQKIVQFFATRFGGSTKHVPAKGKRRAYWRWRVASIEAAAFLTAIRPFVRTNRVREKIDVGLAYQRQKRASRFTEEYRQEQWEAYWWMRELNVRGNDSNRPNASEHRKPK